jgi:CNT family concentrative nucleoside transporter
VMSKIICPETGAPATLGIAVRPEYERESNLFEAVINGANAGVKAVVGIVALLLAVLGLVALVDVVIAAAGGWLNELVGVRIDWTLKGLLGYLFYPLTFLMGVPACDAMTVAGIVGERLVVTEVTGYRDLAEALTNAVITPRSGIITAYALCGFAHFASLAIFIGGFGALAPARIKDLSRVGIRALVAATMTCMMTACIAGIFFSDQALLFGR